MELPRDVQIEPVGECNLRCQMCPIQFRTDGRPHGPPALIDVAAFERMLDELPNARTLHLQGLGEPMIHPRLFEMVAHATRRGIAVSVNSNLTLLTERRAEECVRSGLAWLYVSVDGATPETYERIRVRARWRTIVRNIERLRDTKRRLGSETPKLSLTAVAMRQNLHELPQIVRNAHDWAIAEVNVQHLCHDFGEPTLPERYRPMRRFVEEQTLVDEDPARIERFFSEARETAAALGIKLRLPRTRPRPHAPGTPGRARCDWPWRSLYLTYRGEAMPCCMVSTPDRINFGSVTDHGIEAIWNGDAYDAFRRRLDSEDPPEICRSCAVYTGTF